MPPVVTQGVVCFSRPYSETSLIARLYTRDFGLIGTIAKGVRSRKKGSVLFERGMIVEGTIYRRCQSALATLTRTVPLAVFPRTRSDLCRSTLRDTLLELVCAGVHESEPNEELRELIETALVSLEEQDIDDLMPAFYWRFSLAFMRRLGFGIQFDHCSRCSREIPENAPCFFSVTQGGLLCTTCRVSDVKSSSLSPPLRALFARRAPSRMAARLPHAERIAATRLCTAFCRYHSGTAAPFKAVDFLCDLMSGEPDGVPH